MILCTNISTNSDRSSFLIEFPIHPVFMQNLRKKDNPEVAPEGTPEVGRMLAVITGEMTRGEIQERLGLKDEKHLKN